MTFILVLISAAVVWWKVPIKFFHQDDWFQRWTAFIAKGTRITAWAAVFLPCLLLLFFLTKLQGVWFGALEFFLALAVLLFSLARGAFEESLAYYMQCLRNDNIQAALHTVEQMDEQGVAVSISGPGDKQGQRLDDLNSLSQIHRLFSQMFIYYRFQRWFSVVFCYLFVSWLFGSALGLTAAFAYRLMQLNRASLPGVETVLLIVEWLPARLLGLSFGLISHFDGMLEHWSRYINMTMTSTQVLYHLAQESLGLDLDSNEGLSLGAEDAANNIEQLERLLARSLIVWVLVLALFQIFSS